MKRKTFILLSALVVFGMNLIFKEAEDTKWPPKAAVLSSNAEESTRVTQNIKAPLYCNQGSKERILSKDIYSFVTEQMSKLQFANNEHLELSFIKSGLPLHIIRMSMSRSVSGVTFKNNLTGEFLPSTRDDEIVISKFSAAFRKGVNNDFGFTPEHSVNRAYSFTYILLERPRPPLFRGAFSRIYRSTEKNISDVIKLNIYPNELDLYYFIRFRNFNTLAHLIDGLQFNPRAVFRNQSFAQNFLTHGIIHGDLQAARYFSEQIKPFEPDTINPMLPHLANEIERYYPPSWQPVAEALRHSDDFGKYTHSQDYFRFGASLSLRHQQLLADYDKNLGYSPSGQFTQSLLEYINEDCLKASDVPAVLQLSIPIQPENFGYAHTRPGGLYNPAAATERLQARSARNKQKNRPDPFGELATSLQKTSETMVAATQHIDATDHQRIRDTALNAINLLKQGQVKLAIEQSDFTGERQADLDTLLNLAISQQVSRTGIEHLLNHGARFSLTSFTHGMMTEASYIKMLVTLGLPIYVHIGEHHSVELAYYVGAVGMIEVMLQQELYAKASEMNLDLTDLTLKAIIKSKRNVRLLALLAEQGPIYLEEWHFPLVERLKSEDPELHLKVDQIIYQSLRPR